MKIKGNLQQTMSRIGAWALCLTLMVSILAMPAYAADAEKVTVTLDPKVEVMVDGVSQTFYSASGQEVHPILYNNTAYLPIRSVGELMGKNMAWDEATLTVSLAGVRTAANVTGTPDKTTKRQNVSAHIRPDFIVTVDGTVRNFKDAGGARIYPLFYDGTIYLPLQSAGELLGKTATWNAQTNTATLATRGSSGGVSVTDADTFGGQPVMAQPYTSGTQTISKEKAKSIALTHAGLAVSKVTFAHVYLEKDEGRWEYDIEFYTNDYMEYDYEIDAYTGAILSFDSDAEYYSRSAANKPATNASGTTISAAKAKEAALARAGVSAAALSTYKSELDWDDGVMTYEIEFKSAGYEYDVNVNATNGTITKYSRERDD